eukprot:3518366-Amphidinium_carterae.1
MEQADGTLHEQCLAGDALVKAAWALACTLSALNKVGFIHGDLKPQNVLCKNGWPLLTDFGASQESRAFNLEGRLHRQKW